jgi:adhesin HecA-like repeat protein
VPERIAGCMVLKTGEMSGGRLALRGAGVDLDGGQYGAVDESDLISAGQF